MILVLIIGGGLGWVVHRAHVQQVAVTAIMRAGGTVQYDWQFKDGRRVTNGVPGGTRWLARTLGPHYFDSVSYVILPEQVTDADMDAIASLDQVERLILDTSGLSGAGLAKLDRMTGLRWLTINAGAVDVDTRIMPLRTISRLKGLTLAGTDVTDAGLRCLSGHDRLELLDLEHTRVTDSGVAHLSEMRGMRDLSVENTRISDEGLSHLRRLVKLERLSVNRTRVTAAGVEAFRKALPLVRVRDRN